MKTSRLLIRGIFLSLVLIQIVHFQELPAFIDFLKGRVEGLIRFKSMTERGEAISNEVIRDSISENEFRSYKIWTGNPVVDVTGNSVQHNLESESIHYGLTGYHHWCLAIEIVGDTDRSFERMKKRRYSECVFSLNDSRAKEVFHIVGNLVERNCQKIGPNEYLGYAIYNKYQSKDDLNEYKFFVERRFFKGMTSYTLIYTLTGDKPTKPVIDELLSNLRNNKTFNKFATGEISWDYEVLD
ncbi:hypothetical protein N9Y92_00320 [Chlamydiales bacterium]|nr:hypothetical protein [Chlamydiales bacterium]